MRPLFLTLCQLACLVAFCQLKGKVVSITDGDTFTLLTSQKQQIKIRLYGIDCPENGQDFSAAAQDYLGDLVFGKEVEVEEKGKDQRYHRVVGVIRYRNINVNEALLKAGLAWYYKAYANDPAWEKLEADARTTGKGLWSKKDPVAPWNWRKSSRK